MMNDKTKGSKHPRVRRKKDESAAPASSFTVQNSTFDYADLLGEIKARVRAGQHRAALSANAEMLATYWDIGRMIAVRQNLEGYGATVIPRLAADLKNELPEEKGFSKRNLMRMLRFFPRVLCRSATVGGTSAVPPSGASRVWCHRPWHQHITGLKQPSSCRSFSNRWGNCLGVTMSSCLKNSNIFPHASGTLGKPFKRVGAAIH